MEVIGLFYGHLVYFTAIWYILWPLGLCYYYLAHFSKFWIVFPRKIWQPCRRGRPRCHSCGFEAGILLCSMPWRRGAVDTASATGTEGPGSNPARV
jgi:hypothetical protein